MKQSRGIDIKTATADAGYAYGKVYGALERHGIDALIPAKAEPIGAVYRSGVSVTTPSMTF